MSGRRGGRGRSRAPATGRVLARLLALVAVIATAALDRSGAAAQPARAPAVDTRPHPGKATYDRQCAVCHGETGGADGPGAAGLPIKPPPFTDGRRLNPLPDELLHRIVREGAGAVGLAPQMPAFGRTLGEREIRDVVAYIRTMARPAYVRPVAPPGRDQAVAPAQPIEFSHAIHAGSYGLDCQYCHADARRAPYAGLPSVQRCMGCHKIVAAQGNPEVQKLQRYWNDRQPVPWVRIHKVPGFVQFPHKRHVQVGLACQSCHGPVETMQRVAQVAPLTMGWCLACHAERKGPLDCVTCHH